MIHIGTVHVNGREYSLDLNRTAPETDEPGVDAGSAGPRRNLPTNRSEIFLLNSKRKPAAHNPSRSTATVRAVDDLRRFGDIGHREQALRNGAEAQVKIPRDGAVKIVSRFLSWCFPVREFKSPLQRVLYLSVEKTAAKHRSRYLLP